MILFRIIRNLIRLGLNLLWLPISIITRNLFGIGILLAVILFFVWLNNDDTVQQSNITIPAGSVQGQPNAPVMRAQPAPPPVMKVDGNAPPIQVDAVRKVEDGNSSFAQDLLRNMTDMERAYYSQIFYWTMNNAPAGKNIKWDNANTYGTLTPKAIFLNSRGYACRNFTETLKVHEIKQNIRGVACQRGGGAWCKLGPNATPSCGLGQVPSFWDGVKRSLPF